MQTTKQWLMIADAHLCGENGDQPFFRFLDYVSQQDESVGIVFMGDLYDLWIALPGYESAEQLRFLEWCRTEKEKRPVIFIEGNHEFFVAKTRRDAFTYCDETQYEQGKYHWIHGDRINSEDWQYALLRFLIRNRVSRFLLTIFGHSIGPAAAHWIREKLREINSGHQKYFPREHVCRMLSGMNENQIVFAGHFHDQYQITEHNSTAEILPAYLNQGEVALYNVASGVLETAQVPLISIFRPLCTEAVAPVN